MKRIAALFFCTAIAISVASEVEELCASPDAQLSCGQCIKQHPECAWCTDPHSTAKNRCQIRTAFTDKTCNKNYVYAPPSSAQVTTHQAVPLEAKQVDGRSIVRLEPQAVSVRLMPGHSANVHFKYLHKAAPNQPAESEMMIQTSDVQSFNFMKVKFFIICNGEEKETKTCRVQDNQIVEFRIEVTLDSCSDRGDISISVGIRGLQNVAALYITPICGCECEKRTEMNSPLCHKYGHLVCGQCVCDSTRGGNKCECPLALYGVSNAMQLEDKCRVDSDSEVCSGRGICQCGQCRCDSPIISGKHCQCDNGSCKKGKNGELCSGNGVCDCGVCKCEHGWERDDCSCSFANNNCIENGMICSNHGHCECNRCVCNEGKTGAFCGADDTITPVVTAAPTEATTAPEQPEEPSETEKPQESAESSEEDLDKAEKALNATAAEVNGVGATASGMVTAIILASKLLF